MDQTDLRLFQKLMVNGRLTHRELGEELGLAAPAAHRRVQGLIEEGIFTKFYANLSVGYLKAIPAQIVGFSDSLSIGSEVSCLVKRDYIEKLFLFGSNLITVTVLLPRYESLGPAVEQIRSDFQLRELNVVIPTVVLAGDQPIYRMYSGTKDLTRLDYRIINALHDDARRTVVDVADDLKVSVKTVKARMEHMVDSGAIEFGLDWKPERSSGVASIVRIEVRAGQDRAGLIAHISRRYGPRVIMTVQYHNLPDMVAANCWSRTMDEHAEMIREIGRDERVSLVDSRIVQSTHLFETWRDRLLREKAL